MTFPLFSGQGAGSPVQVLVGRGSASFNLARYIDWESSGGVRIEETGYSADDTAQISVKDISRVIDEITPEGHVLITQDGVARFRGYIRDWEPSPMTLSTEMSINCVGVSSLLDKCIIPPAGGDAYVRRKKESDKARILWLLKTFGQPFLKDVGNDFSHIQVLETEMERQNFSELTLRQAIEQVLAAASESANYYIDRAGRLHTFDDNHEEVLTAPYEVNLSHTLAAGECPAGGFRVNYDTEELINDYYVRGADASGSGRFSDAASIALYGRRSAFIDGPDSDTPRKAERLGKAALRDTKAPLESIRFVVSDQYVVNGTNTWLPGQFVRITSPANGFVRYRRRILRVATTYIAPTGLRKMEIEAGAIKRPRNFGGYSGKPKGMNPARPVPSVSYAGPGGVDVDDSGCCTSPGTDGDNIDEFTQWITSPPMEEGDTVAVSWGIYIVQKGQYGYKRSGVMDAASYDGPGDQWGPEVLGPNPGLIATINPIQSIAGTQNYTHPYTPDSWGCPIWGSWSGWRHREKWWKASMGVRPDDLLAGLQVTLTIGPPDTHARWPQGNPVPKAVYVVVKASTPTDWKQGSRIATIAVDATSDVLIPASLLPAEGGELWVGVQPAWEADYLFTAAGTLSLMGAACVSDVMWPEWSGEFQSGKLGAAMDASATWFTYPSGSSSIGETDVPEDASWGGPYSWQEGARTGSPEVTGP